ncbi:MAG: hypothetical protein JSS65_06530 [Armatimonadetes bacterium]|nr:hypothetical protein [Armatimonadota bacterium]
MKWNASYTAALVGVAAIAAVFAGWKAYNAFEVSGFHPTPVKPGKVTLIGIDTSAGYHIIVANEVAQLAEQQDKRSRSSGEEDAKNLRRIPIREFLQSLQGDAVALGRLTMSLNKISEEELTGSKSTWKSEDIQKALDGDPILKPKLESDLHISLDGTPPPEIRLGTLLGGITVDCPVKIKVPIEGKVEVIEARVQQPYMSKFAHQMEKEIGERFNPTKESIAGMYRNNASKTGKGGTLNEDVAKSLKDILDPKKLQDLAEKPEHLLSSATVLINESHIRDASYREWEGNDRKQYADISMGVTEDGKRRLWKYSESKHDFQLMFIVNDVALAAPTITSTLNQDNVTIAQLPNRTLAKNATEFIQGLKK